VREALNSFLDHEETATWLGDFEENHNLNTIIEEVIA
jgi:hypothetical protein